MFNQLVDVPRRKKSNQSKTQRGHFLRHEQMDQQAFEWWSDQNIAIL